MKYYTVDFHYTRRGSKVKTPELYIYSFESHTEPSYMQLRRWFFQFMDADNTLISAEPIEITKDNFDKLPHEKKTKLT